METVAQHIAEAWRIGESKDELVAHLQRCWPEASYFSLAVCSSRGYLVSSGSLKTLGKLVLTLLRPRLSLAGKAVSTKGWSSSDVEPFHPTGHRRLRDVEAAAKHSGVQVLHSCPIFDAGVQESSAAGRAIGAILLGHPQRTELQDSTKRELEELAMQLSSILPAAVEECLRNIAILLHPPTLLAATTSCARRVHTSDTPDASSQRSTPVAAWEPGQCSSIPGPDSGSGGAGAGGGIEVQTAAEAVDRHESAPGDMLFLQSQGQGKAPDQGTLPKTADENTQHRVESFCAARKDDLQGTNDAREDGHSDSVGGPAAANSGKQSEGKGSEKEGNATGYSRQHWLWDSFEHPGLEKAYSLWHAEHVIPYDIAASVMLVAMCLPLSYGPMHLAHTHPWWLISVLPQLARLLLIRFRRRWFIEHRTALMAAMAVHFWVHSVHWSGVQMAVLARYSPARAASDPVVFNRVAAGETTLVTMIVHPMHLPESVALLAVFLLLGFRHVATRLCPVLPLPGWLCLSCGSADLLSVATAVPLLFARWNSRRLRRTFLSRQSVAAT